MPSSSQSVPPSGEQVELRHGDRRAVVVEVGGGVRAFSVGDWEVLDGYAEDEMCTAARGTTLIPWPNRLRDGAYTFDGRDLQVPLTEPGQGNAIHGFVRWANWTVAERDESTASLEHVLHPRDGYPFALHLRIDYSLGDDGLSVRTTATNVGAEACPYGAGSHPYLTLGTDTIDPVVLRAPGSQWMRTDDRQIPVATEPVDGTEYDFREARELGGTKLDTGYAELVRDDDGRARVEMTHGDRRAALWLDDAYAYLMLFTGDALPDAARRRRGLGVEPMTCAPNAFASGEGLRTLQPGESAVSAWGIEAGQAT